MKVVAVQHVPNEPMGFIESILSNRDIDFEYIRVYKTNEIKLGNFSHLIVMGGPMGVYEEGKYEFLKQEKSIIRGAVLKDLPVLGICLGSQLIASALGKEVYPYKTEIGWYVVKKEEIDNSTRNLPEKMMTFQLHGDTFDLPEGSKLLYSGYKVKNQAFRYRNALGVQFHLEATPSLIKNWVNINGDGISDNSNDIRRESRCKTGCECDNVHKLSNEEKKAILDKIPENIEVLNDNCEKLIESFLSL